MEIWIKSLVTRLPLI